jgi:hypothetical protein
MRTATDTEAKALAMSWVIHLMGDRAYFSAALPVPSAESKTLSQL